MRVNSKGMSGHHRGYSGMTDEWLTPPEIIEGLGPFDLDPCSPITRPWPTAGRHYTIEDNGLSKKWFGYVWVNPPYGPKSSRWLRKLAGHGDGIALIFARTETKMFVDEVWEKANSVFFIYGRLHFYSVDGVRAKANSGAPSVLVSYGEEATEKLKKFSTRCTLDGRFIRLKEPT